MKPEPSIILEGIVVLLAAASMAQAASQLIAQAKDLALAWVKDHQAVPPDEADTVLGVVGRYADSALFDRFQAEAKKAENLSDRQRLIVALGLSKDPRLARKALDALAAHAFQPVDSLLLLFVLSMHAETRSLTYDYLKQRYDAVVAALPSDALFGYLPKTAEGFDTPDRQSDVESFFKDKDVRLTGGPRIIAQVVESIRLNAAFKQAQLPSLSELLRTPMRTGPHPRGGGERIKAQRVKPSAEGSRLRFPFDLVRRNRSSNCPEAGTGSRGVAWNQRFGALHHLPDPKPNS